MLYAFCAVYCVCCRSVVEAEMAQRVDAEKEAGRSMVDSLHSEIQDLKERLRTSSAVSAEGQQPLTASGTGVGSGAAAGAGAEAKARSLQDLEELLKKEIALSAVQADLLEERKGEISICRQQLASLQEQIASIDVEEIKLLAIAAANATYESEKIKLQTEMDRKILDSQEKQREEHAQRVDVLMQEHRAAIDGERRTASEKVESSMTREKSISSLQSTFDDKIRSSDTQLASLKQQLIR